VRSSLAVNLHKLEIMDNGGRRREVNHFCYSCFRLDSRLELDHRRCGRCRYCVGKSNIPDSDVWYLLPAVFGCTGLPFECLLRKNESLRRTHFVKVKGSQEYHVDDVLVRGNLANGEADKGLIGRYEAWKKANISGLQIDYTLALLSGQQAEFE